MIPQEDAMKTTTSVTFMVQTTTSFSLPYSDLLSGSDRLSSPFNW